MALGRVGRDLVLVAYPWVFLSDWFLLSVHSKLCSFSGKRL